jgi:uncharacterized membrane protein
MTAERKPWGAGAVGTLGAVLGAVIAPTLVFFILDSTGCGAGGEAMIACAYRAVAWTALSILPGALVGVFAALGIRARRALK